MKLMIDKTWEVTNKVLEKLAAIDRLRHPCRLSRFTVEYSQMKGGTFDEGRIVALAIIIWVFALTLSLSAWVFGLLGTV